MVQVSSGGTGGSLGSFLEAWAKLSWGKTTGWSSVSDRTTQLYPRLTSINLGLSHQLLDFTLNTEKLPAGDATISIVRLLLGFLRLLRHDFALSPSYIPLQAWTFRTLLCVRYDIGM